MVHQSGPARWLHTARPVARARFWTEPSAHGVDDTPFAPKVSDLRSSRASAHPRRWQHRRHVAASDVAVWLAFTAFCVAIIGLALACVWVVA